MVSHATITLNDVSGYNWQGDDRGFPWCSTWSSELHQFLFFIVFTSWINFALSGGEQLTSGVYLPI
jgi:hypothetical protein